jgi:AcrR family transcriptional regulator
MGLTAEKVVAAAADLADREGYDALVLATLAEELGVRVPSLYKHIGGLGDLQQRVARIGVAELCAAVTDAAAGKQAREALVAVCVAYRRYARVHPGRYAAVVSAAANDLPAVDAVLLRIATDYGLTAEPAAHAAAAVRSAVAGFLVLDQPDDADATFFGVVALLDHGLAAEAPQVRRGLRIPGLSNLPGLPNLGALPTLPGLRLPSLGDG